MAIQTFNTPYEINLNTINGEPVSIAVHSERHIIYDSQIQLAQIPDEFYKVNITGKIERTITETLKNSSDFKVNYKHGVVYFYPSLEGKSITINSYYGKGIKLLYDDRVKVTDLKGSWKSTNLKDLLVEIKQYIDKHISNYDSHVSGESDKHKAPDIDYEGNVNNQTNVKGAIDNLQTQLNQVVNSGTESDARVSQALVDSEDTVYTTLKERNDAWEARTKTIEDEIYSSDYTPEIYNTSSIFTTGKGYAEAGSELDYSESVINGQVNVGLNGLTYTNILGKANTENTILSDNTGTRIGLTNTGMAILSNGYSENEKVFHVTNNNKYFIVVNFKNTSKGSIQDVIAFYNSSTVEVSTSVVEYLVLNKSAIGIVTATSTENVNLKLRESGAGDLIFENALIVNLTELGDTETDLQKLYNKYPYIDNTNSTILAQRIKSTGKNLFDGNVGLGFINNNGGNGVIGTGSRTESYSHVKGNTNITFSHKVGRVNVMRIYEYNVNKVFLKMTLLNGIKNNGRIHISIKTLNDTAYIRYRTDTGFDGLFEDGQLEEGTTETPYEPHQSNKTYISCTDDDGNIEELRSLPNGVKDEFKDGKLHKIISDWYTLDETGIWNYNSQYNYFYRTDLHPIDLNMLTIDLGGFAYSPNLPFVFPLSPAPEKTAFTIGGSYGFYIRIEGITTINDLKNYLNAHPITLIYQLAEPKITELPNIQPLHTYKNGTIQFDNIIHQMSIYNDAKGCIVKHRDYHIKSIDFIKKVNKETGEETSLDVTKAGFVLEDSNKIGFSHPDLVNNDLVEWDYYYENESTNAEKVISYPINTKALIDSNAKSATLNSNSIKTLNNQVSNLMTDLNSQKLPSIKGQAGIIDMPVGAKYGGFNELNVKGQTLVNSVKNGDFSDGTNEWINDDSILSATDKILTIKSDGSSPSAAFIQHNTIPMNDGNIFYFYSKVKVTNSECKHLYMYMRDGNNSNSSPIFYIDNPNQNEWYELHGKCTLTKGGNGDIRGYHYYDNASIANNKVMEVDGNAGVFAINMTALGIEDYTEEQMLNLVRNGYFEGMQSVVNPTFKTEGKNLFDESLWRNKFSTKYNTVISFHSYPTIPNTVTPIGTTFASSGSGTAKFTFNTGKYKLISMRIGINGDVRDDKIRDKQLFRVKPNTDYSISFNLTKIDISNYTYSNFQLEEGPTATPYEPYQSSQTSIKMADGDDCALHSLPNGVRDEIDILSQNMVNNVNNINLKESDISSVYTGSLDVTVARLDISSVLNLPDGYFKYHSEKYIVEGYNKIPSNTRIGQLTTEHINMVAHSTGGGFLDFVFTKGTTLEQARQILKGTTLIYQLAEPTIEDIQVNGSLSSFTGGRLLQWNGYNQAHTADASGKITLNYPIKEIDEIFYFDNEGDKVIETNFNLSSDGISITGLNANTKYHIIGKAKNQIMAQIEGKTVGNKNTQIDSNTTSIKTTNEKLADMQDTVELLMLEV